MPIEEKTINCEHCGKEFTQARKDQKYCNPQCRFDHFFDRRDNEKAQLEEKIETLQNKNNELRARVKELEALQAVPKPKRERLKAPTP
jgi:predicted nuclease with TOPRIM domain